MAEGTLMEEREFTGGVCFLDCGEEVNGEEVNNE